MRYKGVLVVVVLLFFGVLASAELNLVVTASLDGKVTDVFVQTNEEALAGYDVYDLEYPPFPVSSPRIYSIIEENRELIMDSWKSENRKLKIVYSRDEADLGDLDLSFNGDVSGTFKVVLHDYGKDSGYTKEVGASLITGNSVYSVKSAEEKRYFLLDVDYLYCGDGICSDDENCSVCSVDCSGCKEVSGISDPYHFLTVAEIGSGYSSDFSFDQGYKFNFKGEVHSVKVMSISNESVKLLIASEPVEWNIKWNEEKEVDIDFDSVIDFVLKPSLVGNDVVNIYFKGLDITSFAEVSVEQKKVVPERMSIFDSVYGKNKPVWLRILVTVTLLVIGFLMWFFAFLLWRGRVRDKGLVNLSNIQSDVGSPGYVPFSDLHSVDTTTSPSVPSTIVPVQPLSPSQSFQSVNPEVRTGIDAKSDDVVG